MLFLQNKGTKRHESQVFYSSNGIFFSTCQAEMALIWPRECCSHQAQKCISSDAGGWAWSSGHSGRSVMQGRESNPYGRQFSSGGAKKLHEWWRTKGSNPDAKVAAWPCGCITQRSPWSLTPADKEWGGDTPWLTLPITDVNEYAFFVCNSIRDKVKSKLLTWLLKYLS